MAGGWARDGAVQDQIDASIADELKRMQARPQPVGESARECVDCGEEIPQARRDALPGVKLCRDCAEARDTARARNPRAGINRRASKDSQLK
ncbi:hypothetical protein CKO11_16050 [Rhodobacter sp. TJ_12]|uniref:DksA/TraR family C4-type zinc finger protein n=1 Tax=Rhodobacter sp. TJ_12 TaxID=2029399 RepID=UPI001CBF9F76|nr:DksA/TraR family C4-type zinc finger protein [Rhodobacter sp. TJ_12]MBZ4023964.1 hypothetical protein [Rhodobacter sp. TJ_12]